MGLADDLTVVEEGDLGEDLVVRGYRLSARQYLALLTFAFFKLLMNQPLSTFGGVVICFGR